MFTEAQRKALDEPLNKANVKERKQGNFTLSYVEAWHAIAEANRIFGHDGWSRETVELRRVAEIQRPVGSQGRPGWGVSYVAKVRVTLRSGDETVIREGTGAGHGIDVDLGIAHESAIKEAESDAMKRALMTFGNPFGLALYDKTQANVSSEKKDLGPAPMGDDFPGASGKGKSAHQAKKDGTSERFNELRHEISGLGSMTEVGVWLKERTAEVQTMPESWRKILREDLDEQKRLIAADADQEAA